MSARCTSLALASLLGSALACGPVPLADGFATTEIRCTTCHGDDESAAPPRALNGRTDTDYVGVGAHRQHLQGGSIRTAVACAECHVVPRDVADPSHVDALPAEIAFGALASTGDVAPRWDRDTLSCATYCHGDPSMGGKATAPRWTVVDGSQIRCDACHGAPPPAPHPAGTRCVACHADTVDEQGLVRVSSGTHIDGIVQSKGLGCTACHGGETSAPPRDLTGNVDMVFPGVGAHEAHLDGDAHRPVDCAACHIVPMSLTDPGHVDDADETAEVTFGALAMNEGATPTYDDVGCSNTYCHGGARPEWTRVDGTYAACDACHGSPPAGRHPPRTDCVSCHGDVVGPGGTFTAPLLHVDGVVQSSGLACDACHGGFGQPAPPRDTQGTTATTARGVGAHASHLASSSWHATVECGACHLVPVEPWAVGHFDTPLPAEVLFDGAALARGAAPSFDGVGCSNVACHGGASLASAGSVPVPTWTRVDGTQAACGACHGLPPASPHPARVDCVSCHGDVVDAARAFTAPARHVDGVVDVSCNACHGDTASGAPPTGAHAAHLRASDWRAPIDCAACHVVPALLDAPGHRDSPLPAEVVFGALARSDGVNAAFAELTCNVYCHGASASIEGGTLTQPAWTTVTGDEARCGSCHGLPPPSPHPVVEATSCGACHPFLGHMPANPALHINGIVERP